MRADTDRGHLLAFLAVLLHGPDEPADRTQTAPEHHPDHGPRMGKPAARYGLLDTPGGTHGPLSWARSGSWREVTQRNRTFSRSKLKLR